MERTISKISEDEQQFVQLLTIQLTPADAEATGNNLMVSFSFWCAHITQTETGNTLS